MEFKGRAGIQGKFPHFPDSQWEKPTVKCPVQEGDSTSHLFHKCFKKAFEKHHYRRISTIYIEQKLESSFP
jgi:hypothetical protein